MDNPLCKCQHQEQSKSASDRQWVFEGYCRDIAVGGTGLEHTTKTPSNTQLADDRAAKSAAISTPFDAQLQAVIDAWDKLPADVRKMITGVVRLTVEAGKK